MYIRAYTKYIPMDAIYMMLLGLLGADISLLAIAVHFNMRINAAQSVAKSDNLGAALGPKTLHKSAVCSRSWRWERCHMQIPACSKGS